MIVKTYGLYDKVSKNVVRTFTSQNNDTAERAAKYIVREKDFDPIEGCDMIVKHLFDFDSETGVVVDNVIEPICDLKEAYDEYKATLEVEKHE